MTCPHSGCLWQGDYQRYYPDHLTDECVAALVPCTWCGQSVPRNELPTHEGVCPCRPVTCPHCQMEVSATQLEVSRPLMGRRGRHAACPVHLEEICVVSLSLYILYIYIYNIYIHTHTHKIGDFPCFFLTKLFIIDMTSILYTYEHSHVIQSTLPRLCHCFHKA